MRGPSVFIAAATLLVAEAGFAQSAPPMDAVAVERLAALGRLWGAVEFFHPDRPANWDSATAVAASRVVSAPDREAYRAAVASLLGVLRDPATRIVPAASPPAGQAPRAGVEWTEDSVVIVRIPSNDAAYVAEGVFRPEAVQELRAAAAEAPDARGVIFDLRVDDPAYAFGPLNHAALDNFFRSTRWARRLIVESISGPDQRGRMHVGYVAGSVEGTLEGTGPREYILPGRDFDAGDSTAAVPIVFVVSREGPLPDFAVGLQSAGVARIVQDGPDAPPGNARTFRIPLAADLHVDVRLTNPVDRFGRPVARFADTVVTDGPGPAMDVALRWVRNGLPPGSLPAEAASSNDARRPYADTEYPDLGYRVVGLYRLWNTILYFFPYYDLMEEDWPGVLRAAIPRVVGARDSLEYAMAIAETMTRIHDSHGFVRAAALDRHFGTSPTPMFAQIIEGRPVVTGFRHDSLARAAGVEFGDVVISVDGEDALDRIARMGRVMAASTPQAHARAVVQDFTRGHAGTTARVILEGANGRRKEVSLPRDVRFWRGWRGWRGMPSALRGPVTRWLTDDIAYVDLDRLSLDSVDAVMTRFASARSIVFDMRGYPSLAPWLIAPRLADRPDVVTMRYERPIALTPDTMTRGRDVQPQFVGSVAGPRYTGNVVMLIDGRAGSRAEHTIKTFKAAAGAVLIGSPTAGVNGDVTGFSIPGNISLNFSGVAVTHPDGSQFQRIGMLPDIEVRPTIAGIRAGRDEVLEAAVQYLTSRRP